MLALRVAVVDTNSTTVFLDDGTLYNADVLIEVDRVYSKTRTTLG